MTLLVIPETVQQGMIGEDLSITNTFIALSTVVGHSSKKAEEMIEGKPTVLVAAGLSSART